MDFWNRKKVRELELEISHKEIEIKILRNQLRLAEKKISGERVCDGYCQNCVHSVAVDVESLLGTSKTYSCELDCKCKDFQRKDAES